MSKFSVKQAAEGKMLPEEDSDSESEPECPSADTAPLQKFGDSLSLSQAADDFESKPPTDFLEPDF